MAELSYGFAQPCHAESGVSAIEPYAAAKEADIDTLQTRKGWSRRAVLGALAGTMVARGARAEPFDHEVVVVGAGIAGLHAALMLHDARIPVSVLEGNGRLGGRVFSTTGELGAGVVLERGGTFINSSDADMLGLVRRFGLPLFDRAADERAHPETPTLGYRFRGRRFSEGEMAELLRPLARRLKRDARRLDRKYDAVVAELDGLSVREYIDTLDERHGPFDPVGRAMCNAIIRSEYGVEPATSSALQLLYSRFSVRGGRIDMLVESDEVYTVVGGNRRLINAMASVLPEGSIRRHSRVVRIEELEGGGFRFGLNDGTAVSARFAVVTIPFPVLRGIELVFRDPQPSRLLDAIAAAQHGRNEKLFLGVSQRVWQTPSGFRGEMWSDRGLVWEATRTQPEQPVAALTVYLGGAQVDALDSGARLSTVSDAFMPRLPGLAEALTGEVLATSWRNNPFSEGSYSTLAPGVLSSGGYVSWPEEPAEGVPVDVGCRGCLFAGEYLSETYYGYMNGAAETGRRAGLAIAAMVSGSDGTDPR